MTNQKINKIEVRGSKVWLGGDGFLHVEVGKVMTEAIVKELMNGYLKIVRELPVTKIRVLINMTSVPHTPISTSSVFRKDIVKELKKVSKDPGFKKAALWGGGVLQRTVAKFVLTASRLKNVEYFKTEKEAIEWLKK